RELCVRDHRQHCEDRSICRADEAAWPRRGVADRRRRHRARGRRDVTMLARDWYYNDRRQLGLDFTAEDPAASYDQKQRESAERARATLKRLGVGPGWRVADIGCGTGILVCEAAEMGAEVDAIDISPAMLKLTEVHAREKGVSVKTQATGFLSFDYTPETF